MSKTMFPAENTMIQAVIDNDSVACGMVQAGWVDTIKCYKRMPVYIKLAQAVAQRERLYYWSITKNADGELPTAEQINEAFALANDRVTAALRFIEQSDRAANEQLDRVDRLIRADLRKEQEPS